MPRLIVIGDVHDHQDRLTATIELIANAEAVGLVVLAGDVGCDPPWREPARSRDRARHDDSVRRVIDRAGRAVGAPVVFVPGNHDLRVPAADCGGTNVDGRTVRVADWRVAGLGGAGPARFGFPYEWSEDEAAAAVRQATAEVGAGDLDIFISHTPPASTTLDRILRGDHVGSVAVGHAIERLRPKLFVCGHIHEAWGVETLHGVPCLNAGALGEPYGQPLAWRIDWDDGPRAIESVRRDASGAVERRRWPV